MELLTASLNDWVAMMTAPFLARSLEPPRKRSDQ